MLANKELLLKKISQEIEKLDKVSKAKVVGRVTEVRDGIVKLEGLNNVSMMEMLEFEEGKIGIALNLEEDTVGAIILDDFKKIRQGSEVKGMGKILEVGVGEGFIGRVIDPLGRAQDGRGEIKATKKYPVEKIAPGVISRQSVNTPLQTGIKAIDAMIPIGRGQRELIIGDRQTGKTAIAIDAIVNQKETHDKKSKVKSQKSKTLSSKRVKPVYCIYVSIGQRKAKVAQLVDKLASLGAMEYTTVVVAGASDPAALSYLAPYSACAQAEYLADKGNDVLIVYDDLSKHAQAYRQISLLLRRPSGREAYPGDVFYLHSRLLERACKLSDKFGGGSITALPIIETQAGDVSAYIPTNVISITDGQIYLEGDLFYQGVRPALNVGLSVSRVGSAAQEKGMKKVSGQLRLDLAQYRELASFAQFASDLDATTRQQIERGKRVTEILKQNQYSPYQVWKQVVIIYVATNGYIDDLEIQKVKDFEEKFFAFLGAKHKKLILSLEEKKELTEELEGELIKVVKEFKKNW